MMAFRGSPLSPVVFLYRSSPQSMFLKSYFYLHTPLVLEQFISPTSRGPRV